MDHLRSGSNYSTETRFGNSKVTVPPCITCRGDLILYDVYTHTSTDVSPSLYSLILIPAAPTTCQSTQASTITLKPTSEFCISLVPLSILQLHLCYTISVSHQVNRFSLPFLHLPTCLLSFAGQLLSGGNCTYTPFSTGPPLYSHTL